VGEEAADGTGNALDNAIHGDDYDNTLAGLGGNDRLDGAAGSDTLSGGEGADVLGGSEGGDSLDGGVGADEMAGGADDDFYVVDDTGDIVIENDDQGYDFVQASISYVLSANVEGLELLSDAATNGTGNALDNEIYGDSHANTLSGLDGNDWLDGAEGDDTLIGGDGDDAYLVGEAGDVVTENADAGYDFVQASISYVLGANVEGLALWSDAATNGTGNALDNEIWGDDHANVLAGLSGNDRLAGGYGDDTLIGGDGEDSFVFDAPPAEGGVDTVDFEAGVDVLVLDSYQFAGLSGGSLSENSFVVGTAAADADDFIIYDDATGALYFDVDGNGGGAAVQFAQLTTLPTLAASDFLIL
jgi:Ca2+-binding RTX toxin-like protein